MNEEAHLLQLTGVELELLDGYEFAVNFGLPGVPPLGTDASPPLGKGSGPDSEMLLMAAVGNCLSASLAFALRKFKNKEIRLRTSVSSQLVRNAQGRLRMHSIAVEIRLDTAAANLRLAQRAIDQFEDFCTVTQSVRTAIPVSVQVFDVEGRLVMPTR